LKKFKPEDHCAIQKLIILFFDFAILLLALEFDFSLAANLRAEFIHFSDRLLSNFYTSCQIISMDIVETRQILAPVSIE